MTTHNLCERKVDRRQELMCVCVCVWVWGGVIVRVRRGHGLHRKIRTTHNFRYLYQAS